MSRPKPQNQQAALKQPYPILEFDAEEHALIAPRRARRSEAVPENCVLCFFQDEIRKLQQAKQARTVKKLRSEIGVHPVLAVSSEFGEFALFHPGVGGPLSAALFEEVIALGCRKFIVCGGAGVLTTDLAAGYFVIPTSAVRDEGTSYHYLPPAREVSPNAEAVASLEKVLQKHKASYTLGKTWTTDAYYRETVNKIALRKSEGCCVVEMEAAALFAVAQFRQVSLGCILYCGDDVSGEAWDHRGWTKETEIRRWLLWLAAEACLNM